jgi:uncharacterized membrane protein YciS (DUF1049 family)
MTSLTPRVLYCVLIVIPLAGVAVVAAQNDGDIVLNYLAQRGLVGIPVLIVATYLAGVLSGWAVAGFIKHRPRLFARTARTRQGRAHTLDRLRCSLRRTTEARGGGAENGEVPSQSPTGNGEGLPPSARSR